FAKALELLDNGDPRTEIPLAKVLCDYGWMYIRRGELEKAKALLERSWQIYAQNDALPIRGKGSDPRMPLSEAYMWQGNFSEAERLTQNALRDHALREDPLNLAFAYYVLAAIYRAQGKYQEARQYAQQGYTQTEASGDEIFGSYCLMELGMASQLLGDIEDAKRHLRAGYLIRKDFGELKGMTDMLNRLGWLALLEGDNAEARRCYEQAR